MVPFEFFFQVPFPGTVTSLEHEEVSAGLIRQIVVVSVEVTVGESVTGFDVEVVPVSAVMVGAAGGFTVTVIEFVPLFPLESVTLYEIVALPVNPNCETKVTLPLDSRVQLMLVAVSEFPQEAEEASEA